jgi:hypothetical protein
MSPLLVPGSAPAHLTFPQFTYKDGCSSGPLDPINVAFLGDGGPVYVQDHVAHHARWTGDSGSQQQIKTHGGCEGQTRQSSLGFKEKHHTRLFPNPDHPGYAFGDAHREYLSDCGHAVYKRIYGRSGFDQGQRELHSAFTHTNHEFSGYKKGPQRARFKQCNDNWVGWNGRVAQFTGGWLGNHDE